ncbi:hypothetical protein CRX67_16045 [Enterobacteriaceae bacterium A-F18]|nr:hypothetical protein C2U52_28210 [Enterobacteriaceae bacterium ENNIH2]PTA96647.1 hypothetical protein C9415_05420 [Kluyvera sp. Nf5]PWF51441.1 hypothetical protein BHT19_0010980 [[Kluyvera] intestini]QIH64477.1 hypothetical protein CRX67_16045 [Enterobacteriaceae bacterium A-F18]
MACAAKAPKERVERAIAATAYLMVFMVIISQVILLRRRCSVDVISITVFCERENLRELTTLF